MKKSACLIWLLAVAVQAGVQTESMTIATVPVVVTNIAPDITPLQNQMVAVQSATNALSIATNSLQAQAISLISASNALNAAKLTAPAAPAIGDTVRWNGTNWIKGSSYVPIYGYPILCASSNMTHDNTFRSVAVLNLDQIPTGVKALNIQIEAQSTNANRAVTIGSTTNLLEGIGMVYVANIKTYFDCAVAWTNGQTTLGYISSLQGSNEVNRRASVYLLGVWY